VSRAARDRSQDHLLGPLGQAIRRARTDCGVSQEKLANMTGIERSHMGRIERGEANVSFLNLMKIAEALRCDLSQILKSAGY
jgi:transcriptional regulator with XRE-family HTH domain